MGQSIIRLLMYVGQYHVEKASDLGPLNINSSVGIQIQPNVVKQLLVFFSLGEEH